MFGLMPFKNFNGYLGHAGVLEIMSMLIPLPAWDYLPTAMVPCSLSLTIVKTHYIQYHKWKRLISYSHLNCQIPSGSPVELVLPRPLCCELSYFRCRGYSLLLLSYFTYAGSVITTLPAALVDNIYRISIISFMTVLPQSLHANLSLALVYTLLFSILWYRPWGVALLLGLCKVPPLLQSTISQERVRSTTIFHHPDFRTTGLDAVTKSPNKELFFTLIWQENV